MKKNRGISKKRQARRRKKKLKSRPRSLQAWRERIAKEAQRQAWAALMDALKILPSPEPTPVVEDDLRMSCSLNLDKLGRPLWEASGSQEYPGHFRLPPHSLPLRVAGTTVSLQRPGGASLTMDCPVPRPAGSLRPLPGGAAAPQANCLPPLKLALIQTPGPKTIAPQRTAADFTLWKQPLALAGVSTFPVAINRSPPWPEPERSFSQKTGIGWTRLDFGHLGLYQGKPHATVVIASNASSEGRLPLDDKKAATWHEFWKDREYFAEVVSAGKTTKRFRKTSGYIGKSYCPHKRLFFPKNRGNIKNRRPGYYHKPRNYGPRAYRLSRASSQALLRELQAANSTGCSSDLFTLISPAAVQCGCRSQSQDVFDYCYDCMSVEELSSVLAVRLLETKQIVLQEGHCGLEEVFCELSSRLAKYKPLDLNSERRLKRAIWREVEAELIAFDRQLKDRLAFPVIGCPVRLDECQELFTEEQRLGLFAGLSALKQKVLQGGRSGLEEIFHELFTLLADYNQPDLDRKDRLERDILLALFAHLTEFEQWAHEMAASFREAIGAEHSSFDDSQEPVGYTLVVRKYPEASVSSNQVPSNPVVYCYDFILSAAAARKHFRKAIRLSQGNQPLMSALRLLSVELPAFKQTVLNGEQRGQGRAENFFRLFF